MRIFSFLYKYIKNNAKFSYSFKRIGKDSFIDASSDIHNPQNIEIGDRVAIQKSCWLNSIAESKHSGKITIGNGSNLGKRTTISSANTIIIGENVLIGMNVYIADHEHAYENVKRPVMYQGIIYGEGIEIKSGAWIGTNVVISSKKKLTIGKNAVIGANSVVKDSIPDFSLAVGTPAKVVKKHDMKSKKWEKL